MKHWHELHDAWAWQELGVSTPEGWRLLTYLNEGRMC